MSSFHVHLQKDSAWSAGDAQTHHAQHREVRRKCGITHFSDCDFVDIAGSDRKKLLHGLLANEIQLLEPGQGNLHHLLNPKGKIQAQAEVYCLPDSLRLAGHPVHLERLKKNIQLRILRADVKLEEPPEKFITLGLYGPKSTEILQAVSASKSLPEKEYHHTLVEIAGARVLVVRAHETGECGYHLLCPEEQAWKIWEVFTKEKKVPVFGKPAYEILQMEAGVPQWGLDFDEETLSLEINLNKAVSNTKGCYLGQESVSLMLTRGHVAKRLVGLVLEGKNLPESGTTLWASHSDPQDPQAVAEGRITRSAYSPTLDRPIAFAFLKYSYLEKNPGGELLCRTPTGTVSGKAVWQPLPFYHDSGINFLAGGPQFTKVIAPQKRSR